jgi:hypothetical protein
MFFKNTQFINKKDILLVIINNNSMIITNEILRKKIAKYFFRGWVRVWVCFIYTHPHPTILPAKKKEQYMKYKSF